ncbi:RHAU helicase [Carabus blaptoides fortunei]
MSTTDEDDFSRPAITATDVLSDWSLRRQKTNKRLLKFYGAKEPVQLPIQDHRKEFEDLLDNNRVVIIRGEPGCGKSTRIPQYVLEHWVTRMGLEPANIVVTQPRRIAAISLAERVAQERNERVGSVVGYQVRLKSEFNPQTGRILYCTTGILLRQLQSDPAMSRCTHVILDEAHERDVNTDLLMNLMRHALTLNPNLKLIIMSATIDVGLFQKYFTQSPVMNVPGFAYPVRINFLEDIKLNLPRTRDMCNGVGSSVVYDEVAQVISWIDRTKPEGAILCFLPGWEEISKIRNLLQQNMKASSSLIVAIHSKLSHEDQKKIFRRPPPGVRKVILATNIAETSVTVDDVVYVLDTGIHKESRFDSEKGVVCIDNHWISQSSMNQRKGRAGRVQPGESFHLYTREKYDAMLKYSVPEILRVSLTKIVLDAKVYSHNMKAIDFFTQLPCPPDDSAVWSAVQELQDLEMLDANENLTPLGRVVSDFQLPPKLSKAMIHSVIYKCVVPIVDIVTLFSSDQNMFSNMLTNKQSIKQTKEHLSKDSDHIAMMILFEQWANFMNNEDFHEAATYCTKHNLVPHKLNTLKQLKDIHYDYLAKYLQNVLELSDDYSASKEFIKGVLLSGVGNVLLHRNWDVVRGRLKKSSVFVTKNKHKATVTIDSVNHKRETYQSPFFIYINEMRSEMRRTTIIRETSMIQPLTLMLFKNSELSFQQILDVNSTNIEDPVLVNLEGTRLFILCNKQQIQVIRKLSKMADQTEKAFQRQHHVNLNRKGSLKKKPLRLSRSVGLGFKTPREAIEGSYIDKKCPFTGNVSIRGRILTGVVQKMKMQRTIVIRRDYLHYIRKYNRFEKRHRNMSVHLSPCFRDVEIGDVVTIGECRPLSKTVRFNVLKVTKGTGSKKSFKKF